MKSNIRYCQSCNTREALSRAHTSAKPNSLLNSIKTNPIANEIYLDHTNKQTNQRNLPTNRQTRWKHTLPVRGDTCWWYLSDPDSAVNSVLMSFCRLSHRWERLTNFSRFLLWDVFTSVCKLYTLFVFVTVSVHVSRRPHRVTSAVY